MLDLHARFAAFFPIGDELAVLEVVEPSEPPRDDGAARVTVRLIIFDADTAGRAVRDIKEQEVYGGDRALYEDEARVDEMLHAQREVLGEVLRGELETLGTLMPNDLLLLNVLKLKTARTREDFARALRAKSRLGKHLGG